MLTPTTARERALAECGLTAAERVVAELYDGERSIGDVQLTVGGLPGVPLSETGLYAVTWGLVTVGALRTEEHATDRLGLRAASTVITTVDQLAPKPGDDRRKGRRDSGERPGDRAIDRERVLAKQAQISDCDYFSVLGVDRQATPHEINRAYERLRLDFQPDRFAHEVRHELGAVLAEIQDVLEEARRVLLDEGVRQAYAARLVDPH